MLDVLRMDISEDLLRRMAVSPLKSTPPTTVKTSVKSVLTAIPSSGCLAETDVQAVRTRCDGVDVGPQKPVPPGTTDRPRARARST
jgi:hypothetical protein